MQEELTALAVGTECPAGRGRSAVKLAPIPGLTRGRRGCGGGEPDRLEDRIKEKARVTPPGAGRAVLVLPACSRSLPPSLHPFLPLFLTLVSFSQIAFPPPYLANTPPPQDSLRLKMLLENVSLERKLLQRKAFASK